MPQQQVQLSCQFRQTERLRLEFLAEPAKLFGCADQNTVGTADTAGNRATGNGSISPHRQHLLFEDICLPAFQLRQMNTEHLHLGNHFIDAVAIDRNALQFTLSMPQGLQ